MIFGLCVGFGWTRIGHADEATRRVLVVRTGQEPACLAPSAVASAITRHAAFPAQVVLQAPNRADGVVEIRVRADGDRVAVEVRGDGHDLTGTLEGAPCHSMPDVVAAFVASTLAPPLDVAGVPQPIADAELTAATRAMLGAALAANVDLGLSRAAGVWTATLAAVGCTQARLVGVLPAERDVAARRAADVVLGMLAEREGCAQLADQAHAERAVLLAGALPRHTARDARKERDGKAMGLAIGVAISVGSLLYDDDLSTTSQVLTVGSAAVLATGGTLAYTTWPSRHSTTMSELTFALGFGTLIAADAFSGVAVDDMSLEVQRDSFHETDLIFGATIAVTGVWRAIDGARQQAPSRAELGRIRERIKTPQQRAQLSATELAAYERTFLASERPRWRYLVPPAAASIACLLLSAYETNAAESERQLIDGLILGGLTVGLAAWYALVPDPVVAYQRRLRQVGVDLTVAPLPSGAALSMSGRF